MEKFASRISILGCCLLFGLNSILAQNPFVLDQFAADPSARVFDGKVYVYPSHDIPCQEGQGFIGFCMADYHVFSSENLVDWKDHGVIISQENVPWVNSATYSMWAPDCIYKDGKYYFYFPAISRDTSRRRSRANGVAVSDMPYGPFTPEPEPIAGMYGIDPNPFIDKGGQAYIYWGSGERLLMAKLKDNMKELATEPQVVEGLPSKFKEGPYLFERNGIYYFTFAHVEKKTERLAYAIGDNAMGPFKYMGVIMDESPTGCWTNHHSIIEYEGQWYLFYHHNDLSPEFDKNRSISVDSLFFNEDGSLQKVIPSLRGVGISEAGGKVQVDRYSAISEEGASIEYLDSLRRKEGWKILLDLKDSWVRYNGVNFGDNTLTSVDVKAISGTGSSVEIRLDKVDGRVIAQVGIMKSRDWGVVNTVLSDIPSGIHDLFILLLENKSIEIDWISFK